MESSTNSNTFNMEKNAFTETMKMVEDEFYEFNELINHNLKIDSDIEKQLEKKDKKCSYLKHTIENLKKKLEDGEKISNEHRKYIFDQQMELEQISSTIYEQMEHLQMGYPKEDVKYHLDMVNVVQQMFQYVKNFKDILQNDVDDYMRQSVSKDHWKNASEQLINRIAELKTLKSRLLVQLNELKNLDDERSSEDLNKRILELQEIRNELERVVSQLVDVNTQKKTLTEWKQQIIVELENSENSASATYYNCDKMNKICADLINSLPVDVDNAVKNHNEMLQELEGLVHVVENQFKKYDTYIDEKRQQLEDLKLQKNNLKNENAAEMKKFDKELSELKISIEMLKEQKQFSENILSSTQLHTSTIKKSFADNVLQLETLTNELSNLKFGNDLFLADREEMDEDSEQVLLKINKIKCDLENITNQNGQLEREHKQLKQEFAHLQALREELKCKIDLHDTEYDFLNALSSQISKQVDEEHVASDKKMNEKIEKCIENVNELGNVLFEKNLLLDAIKADVETCNDSIPSLELKIWTQNKDNNDKKAKISQIQESISNEKNISQSKINLLEDLERSTFPRNQIPAEWFQTFEKHRIGYERLKNERKELEEKRNKVILVSKTDKEPKKNKMEMKLSDIFGDADSKHLSTTEAKNAAFKMFKERISKKDKTAMSK